MVICALVKKRCLADEHTYFVVDSLGKVLPAQIGNQGMQIAPMPVERVLDRLCLVPRLLKRLSLTLSLVAVLGVARHDIATEIEQ
jgi:hypothetical protein